MLHRIKWEEDNIKSEGTTTDIPNQCSLVWEVIHLTKYIYF